MRSKIAPDKCATSAHSRWLTGAVLLWSVIASVTSASAGSDASLDPVTLPIEVMGTDGTVVSVLVNLTNGASGTAGSLWPGAALQVRVHGVRYETEASIQVNNSPWMQVSAGNVRFLGNGEKYGGIGGGFSTLDLVMTLPDGTLAAGTNIVRFRFDRTDGRASGYRVLSFNFLDGSGNPLLAAASFVNEDPNGWQAPLANADDVAAGRTLWSTAALTTPTPNGAVPLQAHCSSCHAQDGRDLKYFNYSNNAIRSRSVFHGLTAQQGDQIASYIRSLPVANPGRPWNPPYQPGPGLDSQPVANWAAGAGIDAVAANGPDTLNDLFPGGVQDAVFSPLGHLNTHEIRIAFQLLDWNQWLPSSAPEDIVGPSTFANSDYNRYYQALRANLRAGDGAAYTGQTVTFQQFIQGMATMRSQIWPTDASAWTAETTAKMYALPLWGLVKTWEINQEFQLEGMAQSIFGPQADSRAWYSAFPFTVSPNFQQIPAGPGLANGKQSTHDYIAFSWYQTQLILNNSNKKQNGVWPIDWGYSYGMLVTMNGLNYGQAPLLYEWLINGLQIQNNGGGPDNGGWASDRANLNVQVLQIPAVTSLWAGIPPATRAAMSDGFLKAWLSQVSAYTPQQFYSGGYASASQVPQHGLGAVYGGRWIDTVWYSIPEFHNAGASQATINAVADWAKTIWPLGNWDDVKTASCTLYNGGPESVCATEQ